MKIDKVDKAIKEEQILYDIAKDRYEKLGIKNYLRRMEEHKQYIELFEELKELREENEKLKALCGGTEEQGLLLRLPCKVGDIVYSINHNEKHGVTPVIVVEIKFSATGLTNKPYTKIICSDSDLRTKGCKEYDGDDFGKTIFLTQEEAEQKLSEMRGGVDYV